MGAYPEHTLFVDKFDQILSDNNFDINQTKKYYRQLKRQVQEKSGVVWNGKDDYGYIFTSGTTGLPKACVIVHSKVMGIGYVWKSVYGVDQSNPKERLYTAMPMYHSAGGVISWSNCLHGLTMVVERKFSASKYFAMCLKYKCTVSQYIGEMARYLLATPPGEVDKAHNVRIFIGNGMRQEIWMSFVNRFGLQQIGEFYGSTEGNIGFTNFWDKKYGEAGVGACGRAGDLVKFGVKFELVKHDTATELPVIGQDGKCIPAKLDEPGELLGFISADTSRAGTQDGGSLEFRGYTDKKATEKKLIRNVKQQGDLYFRTGDLVRRDAKGWIRFVDRVGDTFRWKGENVSTNEVEMVLALVPGILAVNVYGIKVPGNPDGRACMAAIVLQEGVNETKFLVEMERIVKSDLASYAQPLFVRFMEEMSSTGTLKQQKVSLVKQGIEIPRAYWFNRGNGKYEILTDVAKESIVQAKAKL
eukprot:snap_masked-scaffold_7-processed-gene-11.23-mRNA-1 protein AED:0.30 eAED:0.30 QI:94/1/1/1/1/1/3/66/471